MQYVVTDEGNGQFTVNYICDSLDRVYSSNDCGRHHMAIIQCPFEEDQSVDALVRFYNLRNECDIMAIYRNRANHQDHGNKE